MLYMVEISYENGNEAFMLVQAESGAKALMLATSDFSDEIVVASIFARRIEPIGEKILWNRTVQP